MLEVELCGWLKQSLIAKWSLAAKLENSSGLGSARGPIYLLSG